ncbi:putative disease resistance protein RGA3 [Papaver somniferum]|uniref:putative disease resistance protein RGA3 n=1 Tax=Papaver somniferum TaxID=3469 RepID=UPI000E6F5D7A|nr:putative disease resistance protein RGA3 [Papaver somniferum]
MAYRVKHVSEKLKKLKTVLYKIRKGRYTTSSNTNKLAVPDILCDFDIIIGREKDISSLVDLLITPPSNSAKYERQQISVVPIVGMGGLGKTRLAQSVYNDQSVIKHFELRIWVSLSTGFDLKEVLREIIRYIDTNAKYDDDYGSLQLMIRQVSKMLNGKKYLLVLDDLWGDIEGLDNWERLQHIFMCGSHESKILITTRKVDVASNVLRITPAYHLQQLSTDECWSIIKEKAYFRGGVLEDPKMVNIGKEIARTCCGLPLAARELGNILCSKTKDLDQALIIEAKRSIYSAMKLSYDRLPSSALKQCFAYCSIFPRGWEIDRETIIQLWMAEGFLVPSSGEISMEDVGNKYLNMLLSDSLFQSAENKDELSGIQKCKLHDFAHYLAKKVVSDSETRRLVFDEDMPRMFPEVAGSKNRLRTVVALEAGDCDNIENVFRNRNLRVICLRGSSIQKVPASLSKLRHLRYLNLSGCSNLDVLDDQSVNSLYNLQTLVLHGCNSLSKLPEGIGSLRSLRHLDISYTGIKILPTSVTSLRNLRTLDVSNCRDFEELPEDIGALKDLQCLDISHTKVTKLPDSICCLTRLEKLRLHPCPNLKALPRGIEACA